MLGNKYVMCWEACRQLNTVPDKIRATDINPSNLLFCLYRLAAMGLISTDYLGLFSSLPLCVVLTTTLKVSI